MCIADVFAEIFNFNNKDQSVFGTYNDALIKEGATTVEFLLLMSEDDLKGLGVRPLHAKALLKKARELEGGK